MSPRAPEAQAAEASPAAVTTRISENNCPVDTNVDSREPTEGERPQSIMEGAGAAVVPRHQALLVIRPAWWEMRERWVLASKDETMSSTGSVAPRCVWDVLFS